MGPTWVLGDPHAGHDAEADAALLELLHRAAEHAVDLVVMGDLFVAWIARPRFFTPLQANVVAALESVRNRGGRVRFVVGNRDYLVDGLLGSAFDAVYADEVLVDVGGAKTLLLHGDGLDPEDRPYRAWRAFSRSAPARALLEALPGAVGRQLAERTERGLRDVNTQYKTGPLPVRALEAVSRRAARAGAARAIVGHFHDDATITADDGVPVHVAPGWFERRVVLEATPDALRAVAGGPSASRSEDVPTDTQGSD